MCNAAHHDHSTACVITEKTVNRVDPRVKIVAIFGFVAVVSSLSSVPILAVAAVLMTALAFVSGITPVQLAKRVALVLPFTGFILVFLPFMVPGNPVFNIDAGLFSLNVTDRGLDRAAILSLRVLGAVLAVNVLTASTPLADLMRALRELRVPGVFVQVLEFTVRYIYVLAEEVKRMRLARKSRCFETGRSLFDLDTFKALGHLVGVLFVRSWDRGERIYNAMLSRGYTGDEGPKAKVARPGWTDICWGMGVLAVSVGLRLFEKGTLAGLF
ncbi:MAG: cobalt ECF transporter T component CbiQ [Bacillota bacterium]